MYIYLLSQRNEKLQKKNRYRENQFGPIQKSWTTSSAGKEINPVCSKIP